MSFLTAQVKHVVPFWYFVDATGRKPEMFHPDEYAAAEEYMYKCIKAGLTAEIRKEYTQ
jgi:hypothetical protein